MKPEAEFCVVLTTTDTRQEANRLAESLITEKLAACVQISEITSHFIWEGKPQIASEFLLLLKTRSELYDRIEAFIQSQHSYTVPELVLIPVKAGLQSYLSWIRENTS